MFFLLFFLQDRRFFYSAIYNAGNAFSWSKPEEIRIQEISKLIINVGTWNLFFLVKINRAVYRKLSK